MGVGLDARERPFSEGSSDRQPTGQRVGVPGLGHRDLTPHRQAHAGWGGGKQSTARGEAVTGTWSRATEKGAGSHGKGNGCPRSTEVLRALEATEENNSAKPTALGELSWEEGGGAKGTGASQWKSVCHMQN